MRFSQLGSRLAVLALSMVVSNAVPKSCENQNIASDLYDEWKHNVVSVRGVEGGFGLVVGWDLASGDTWIVVPAHVVYGPEWKTLPAAQLKATDRPVVRFNEIDGPAENCVTPPRLPWGDLDLTFICAISKTSILFDSAIEAVTPISDTELTLIGAPSGVVEKTVNSGTVDPSSFRAVDPGAGGDIFVKGDLRAEKTQSGASAASVAGIMGIYLGHGDQSVLLSLKSIQEKADHFDVRWSLTPREYFDCTKKRNACVVVTNSIDISTFVLDRKAVGDQDEYSLTPCGSVPEGKYAFRPGVVGFRCQPDSVSVYGGNQTLDFNVACSIDMNGIWASSEAGQLTCAQTDNDSAQCTGFGDFQNGPLRATFMTKGSDVKMNGQFFPQLGGSTPVTGSFRWSEGALRGAIKVYNTSTSVTLTRQ